MGMFSETTRLKTARFTSPGDTFEGIVKKVELKAVPEFNDAGRIVGPKFEADGSLVQRPDILIEDSEGRTVIHASVGISIAIAQALEEIKAPDLHPGDHLTLTYETDEIDDGDFPTKLYTAAVVKAAELAKIAAE